MKKDNKTLGKSPKKSSKGAVTVAVEFYSDWCKLLILDTFQGKFSVNHCQVIELAKGDTQLLKERLAPFKNHEPPAEAILIIPRPVVIFREIKLPSVDPNELKQMIELQVENLNPNLKKEEIVYGYDARQAGDGNSSVFLYLMKKDAVKQWVFVLKQAGLWVRHVFLSSETISRLASEGMKQANESGAILGIIDVDRLNTELTIVDKNKGDIFFSRAINLGSKDLAEKKISADRYLEDLFFTLMAYERGKLGPEIERLVITGARIEAGVELAGKLGERLGKPVLQKSAEELSKWIQPADGLEKTGGVDGSLTALLGGLICQRSLKMDFFPEEIRGQERRKKFQRSLILSAVLMGVLLIVWGLIVASWIQRDRYLVKGLTVYIQQMKPLAKQLENQKKRLEVVKTLAAKRGVALDSLRLLQKNAPAEMTFTSLNYSADSMAIGIQGASKSLTAVFEYISRLKESGAFMGVTLKSANKRRTGEGEMSEFQIEAKVVPEKLYASD